MSTVRIAMRRTVTVLLTGTLLVAVAGTSASAAEKDGKGGHGKSSTSQGANSGCGEYCSTKDGSPSENGNGDGKSTGRPCAGCVGKADDKNPPGQRPNGSDSNNGYECDGNSGIARGNPAHTGCTPTAPTAPAAPAPVVAPVAPPAVEVAPKVVPVRDVTPVIPAQVLGKRLEKPAKQAAEVPQDVTVGAHGAAAPQVLGTTLTRPAGSNNAPGALPFTGVSVVEMLLAAVALLVLGCVAMRAATARQRG